MILGSTRTVLVGTPPLEGTAAESTKAVPASWPHEGCLAGGNLGSSCDNTLVGFGLRHGAVVTNRALRKLARVSHGRLDSNCLAGCLSPWKQPNLVVRGQVVALFNVGGTLYALDGICPHQGGPLGSGRLDGAVVTCPWHGWQFDVRTGQHLVNGSICHPRYDVKVTGNDSLIRMEDGDERPP